MKYLRYVDTILNGETASEPISISPRYSEVEFHLEVRQGTVPFDFYIEGQNPEFQSDPIESSWVPLIDGADIDCAVLTLGAREHAYHCYRVRLLSDTADSIRFTVVGIRE
jgi:hypothetical protein